MRFTYLLIFIFMFVFTVGCVPQRENQRTYYTESPYERTMREKRQRDLEYAQKEKEVRATATPKDFGIQPKDYKKATEIAIKHYLKDPESARFTWIAPIKVIYREEKSDQPIPCWEVIVFVNAKNSFGGYVGDKPYKNYYKDNKLIGIDIPNDYE